jgi:hypothetical protein
VRVEIARNDGGHLASENADRLALGLFTTDISSAAADSYDEWPGRLIDRPRRLREQIEELRRHRARQAPSGQRDRLGLPWQDLAPRQAALRARRLARA